MKLAAIVFFALSSILYVAAEVTIHNVLQQVEERRGE